MHGSVWGYVGGVATRGRFALRFPNGIRIYKVVRESLHFVKDIWNYNFTKGSRVDWASPQRQSNDPPRKHRGMMVTYHKQGQIVFCMINAAP